MSLDLPPTPATGTESNSDWFHRQVRASANHLAAMDPAVLSPVGRRLRLYAREMLADEDPVDYDQPDAQAADRASEQAGPLAQVINLADYRRRTR